MCFGHIFWWGCYTIENSLTELYYNLSYETLSGGRNFNFEVISDLVADMRFQIKTTTLSNLKRKRDQDKKVLMTLKILINSLARMMMGKNLNMN